MTEKVEIDSKKLDAILSKKGLKKAEVSRTIGYASNFVTTCIARGHMSRPALMLLCMKYGIEAADITAAPDKPEYQLTAKIQPDGAVFLTVSHGQKLLYGAAAKIYSDDACGFAQAASAAMAYITADAYRDKCGEGEEDYVK